MRQAILAGLALGFVTGCAPGMPGDGGPCSYDEMDFKAKPTGFNDNAVLFDDPLSGAFSIQKDQFAAVPTLADTVDIHVMRITDGTCTPLIYRPSGK